MSDGGVPIRWWWVRHAPTRGAGLIGWTDAPADLGDAAALDRLRRLLPEEARLVSSDLSRAAATAEALARPTWSRHALSSSSSALREQHFGDWEGLRHEELPPDQSAAFWRDPAGAAPPGGESFADVCDRVADAIVAEHAAGPGDVVAVAHAGAIRAALALALGLPPARALSFRIDTLSLTRLDWFGDAGGWGVQGVNLVGAASAGAGGSAGG